MNLLKSFFSYQYLFQVNTAFISPQEKLFGIGGLVLVLLAVVLKISSVLAPTPVDGKYRGKFFALFLTIGLGEIFWYFCRYENVSFFNTRFIALLILLMGFIWLLAILVKIFKNYRREKTVWEKEQVRQKYLPN